MSSIHDPSNHSMSAAIHLLREEGPVAAEFVGDGPERFLIVRAGDISLYLGREPWVRAFVAQVTALLDGLHKEEVQP
mgnify:CR=1 FL=1